MRKTSSFALACTDLTTPGWTRLSKPVSISSDLRKPTCPGAWDGRVGDVNLYSYSYYAHQSHTIIIYFI